MSDNNDYANRLAEIKEAESSGSGTEDVDFVRKIVSAINQIERNTKQTRQLYLDGKINKDDIKKMIEENDIPEHCYRELTNSPLNELFGAMLR